VGWLARATGQTRRADKGVTNRRMRTLKLPAMAGARNGAASTGKQRQDNVIRAMKVDAVKTVNMTDSLTAGARTMVTSARVWGCWRLAIPLTLLGCKNAIISCPI
jgi:hypothetical protein